MNPLVKLQRLPITVWLTLTVLFLLLSIFGIVTVIVIWYFANQLVFSYGIIIDAGSTSTKVYLYSWPEMPFRTNGEVSEVVKCRSSPGISDFVDSVDEAYVGIKYCLEEELLPNIPERMRKKSFVYLGATAGMRLVEENDPNATAKIFEAVENYLLTTDLRFNKSLNDIKIISGVVEGIGAWISVNYLKGTLQNSKLWNMIFPKKKKTYGALDLGGASTQITFVPDVPSNSSKEKHIRLYGYNYSIYSHSYLCYGKSVAEYRLLAHLIQNFKLEYENFRIGQIISVKNPCMLKGDNFTYPIHEIITAPCMSGEYAIKNFGYEITYPSSLVGKVINITFRGSGDVDKCQLYIDKLFSTTKCDYDSCAFNNVYRPKLSDRFLAFSGFDLVEKLLLKRNNYTPLDFDSFHSQSIEYCKEAPPAIDEAGMDSPRMKETEIFRKWRCFDFLYVFNLLKNFGFDKSNWKSIQFISKVNNANLGWSLGYMINKTALVPIEQPLISMSLGTFVILFILFFFVLLFGMVFAFITLRRYRHVPREHGTNETLSLRTQTTDHKSSEDKLLCKV